VNIHLRYLIVAISILIFSSALIAQESAKELEKKRKKLETEIEYTNQLIKQTQKSKQSTINELKLLNSQISKRNELIATLKKELYVLNTKIENTEISLKRLNDELDKLKKEYARIISFAYKHQKAHNKLIYLFSAEDLNQAYQRLRYLDQISEYIRNEAETIRIKEKNKEAELAMYYDQVAEKKNLLNTQNTQVSALEREQVLKDDITRKLTGKEKQLRADLRAKENETKKLDKKIAEIIAKEIAAKQPKKDKEYTLSPEELELSSSFISNKSKLPWPVERGIISEDYGVHQHPALKNVKVKNNGINISTSEKSDARSVFKGKVVSIAKISASNIAVIINHGEYFTVYSNLDMVYVKMGDEVETMQAIGKIHTSLKGNTELHFQVWKGKEIQNPSSWISKN
jgi:septal ring factor EnvC (AmiA/AmiB activator)